MLRHSTAHVMAQAVLHLWPEAKIAIGPAIADGFYYDFEFPEPIGPDDLERIEAEMRKILQHQAEFRREDDVDKAELLERFRAEHQPYKLELAEGLPDGEISVYRNDDFEDLCRGPHLQSTTPIKAFKLLSQAGAYWRGDSSKPMLTRIYGTAFFKQADLDEHLRLLEEARRRDHRRIGRELDLFHTSDVAPGAPFWHPRGMVICTELTKLWRELNAEWGYREVRTPIIYSVDIWRRSGHWDKYRDNMFFTAQGGAAAGREADELPRPHRALPGGQAQLPRPADAPGRAGHRAPRRALRRAARPPAGHPHHPGRRPHLLPRGSDRGRGDRLPRSWPATSTRSSTCPCASSSRRGPTTGSATTPCGTGPRPRSRARLRGRAPSTS